MSYHDANLLAGVCGFSDHCCEVVFDNFTVRNLRRADRATYAPWTDDFEDGEAGDWVAWAGTWFVTNTSPITGSCSLHQTDAGNDRARFMNRRVMPFGAVLSADVRMTGGSGEEATLLFGSRSTDTRLECIFRGRGYNDILANRRVDGSDAWTGSLPLPFPIGLNTTYKLRAEWRDTTVTLWIGTNELVRVGSFAISSGLTDGLVGLCTYRTAAIFDNVSCEPLCRQPTLTRNYGVGTNLVTLTAYDSEGQAATGTVTLVMQPGDAPTADAGGPYAVDEFTGQVENNGWLVTLDGSGSSDPTSPTNRLHYLWDLGTEAFDGTTVTTGKWITSSSGISQSDALTVTGAGSWGTRYAFTRAPIARRAGTAFQATITPPSTCHAMIGLKNTSTTYSYTAMPYCMNFHDSDYIEIHEDGNNRGRVAQYTPGTAYEVRIDLKDGNGARYYLRPAGAGEWQLIYDSSYGTTTAFLRGLDVHTGAVVLDDLREVTCGQTAEWRFYGVGLFTANLVVTDPTGVAETNGTTVTTSLNDPPVANGGADMEQGESNAIDRVWTFNFSAGGSSDDYAILSYEWDWDYDGVFSPSGDTGVNAAHTWTETGVYTVAVRVTDQAMQSQIDTLTVTVTIGAPPTADPGAPYEVDEFSGNASNAAWNVALDGNGSSDAESSLVQYIWTVGEECFDTNAYMREKWFYSSDAHITNGVLTFDWVGGAAESGHYCFTRDRFQRVRGLRAETRIRFINTDQEIAFGFRKDNQDNTHWNQWVYGLHNHYGTLHYVEGGAHESLGRAVQANVWYDWRIELNATTGARYYLKLADDTEWTLVRSSSYSTDTFFRRGYHNYHGSFEADSYQECAAGVAPSYRVYIGGTNTVTLSVLDQALQTNTAATTLACLPNDPPVAEAGADRYGNETNCTEGVWFFTFDAAASTDDHGIYTYEWDWDYDGTFEPSGDANRRVQHGFAASRLGTNTVALRVTDHVLQQHVDTCLVILTAGAAPVANAGADQTVETGWPLTFDGTGSFDDTGVSRYAWDFGDGATGTGPRPRHIYRSAAPTNYTVVLLVYDAAEQVSAPSTALVSVVTSTTPLAEAGGPYSAGANGPPAYFDGSASSDDIVTNVVQGVAKYLWDIDTATDSDGDGTADNDVDLVGRRPFHVYTNAGEFICKLTVVDAAGQSNADLTTVSVATNLAPHVICVPLHGNPDSPHLVYTGKVVTLKGIVRDAGALTYSWDYGDGVTSAVAAVTDKYAIQATHAYSGPVDRPYIARLTVWDANGLSGSDEYRLIVRPDSQATRADIAADEGLWWLHKNQNRENGYWNNPTEGNTGYRPSAAAGAVQALLTNGHRPEGDPTEDPYVETVNRGFDYLFSILQTRAMSAQPAGDPDTNGNGIGLEVNTTHRGYQQGMTIDTIASTQDMLGMARTGIAGVKHAFYFDIVTDMLDALYYGQCDPSAADRGGWRYDWNAGTSDNSISQWGAVAMLAADNNFGIKAPSWVREENVRWLAYSFVSGAYVYRPGENFPWGETVWHATQPSALIQMAINNIYVTNATWRTAETTIADNWNSVYGSAANKNYYALYALTKAMRLARPRPVTYLENTFLDWYNDADYGVQQKVTAHQEAGGYWSAWYRDNGSALNTDLSTAWAVLMLTPTLFSQAPVPVITAPNVWGFGVPMQVNAGQSFHIDAARTIVKYEWDFDDDGVYDLETDDPNDPAAVWTYPDPNPGVSGDTPEQHTIRLRVTDDNTPAQTALTTFTTTLAEPPHKPYAEAGGPYSCYIGETVTVSGAGSYDIDPSDLITLYEWDFDLDETPDTAGAGPVTNLYCGSAGERIVALRVWDNGVMNGGTNLVSDWDYALVDVLPFDADGDGIYDKWEREYWNDVTTASSNSNHDTDSFTDFEEYAADTIPTNGASRLMFEAIVPLAGTPPMAVNLTWQSVTTRLYGVDRSTGLQQQVGGFLEITSDVPGEQGSTSVTLPAPPAQPVFYRVRAQ
ncbi:MAG: PKD domain-containing protein [Kiritimatiellae bacterium]|nr:PKD domain-containing protein [Kiritimatiellia bacterium]